MARHGLSEIEGFDDVGDILSYGRWRGAVASILRGKRGQAFLRELLRALDALPMPRLISGELEDCNGEVCALGAVGRVRGLQMAEIDIEDYEQVATAFFVHEKLAQEVMFINDEWGYKPNSVPGMEHRFRVVRDWVLKNIRSKGHLVQVASQSQTEPK